MKIYFYILFIFISTICASGGLVGSAYEYGTNAKSISLSNAMISSYNRGNNAFSNPSLLGGVKKNEYSFSHFSLSLDRFMHTMSISLPVPDEEATLGLSFFVTGVEDIPETVDDPTVLGDYSTYEGYLMLSFGAKFSEKLSLGINFRFMKNEIFDDYSANGLGSDIGMLFEFSNHSKLGITINNLYSKYSWDFNYGGNDYKYDEKFYRTFALGFSTKVFNNILFLSQVEYISDIKKSNYRIGFEKEIFVNTGKSFMVRSGVNYKNNLFNPSFGLGYTMNSYKNFNIDFDYAIDTRTIGNGFNHLCTLTFYKK